MSEWISQRGRNKFPVSPNSHESGWTSHDFGSGNHWNEAMNARWWLALSLLIGLSMCGELVSHTVRADEPKLAEKEPRRHPLSDDDRAQLREQ